MHMKEIPIICRHTLARSSRKISARSVYRGLSNQPRPRSTRVKDGENWQFLGNMWNINFIFSRNFWGWQVYQTSSIIYQKKPKTLGYQHVKGYQDRSTWAGEKGGVKISTDFESPCSMCDEKIKKQNTTCALEMSALFIVVRMCIMLNEKINI